MTTPRNTHLIVTARLISDFGAFLNMVALATYVYLLSNSAMSVGIFLASRVGGGIFASLIGTAFYRRWSGRAAADCLRSVARQRARFAADRAGQPAGACCCR